jgi:hypothetical protein
VRRRRIIHRKDANQDEIVLALRAAHRSVDIIGEPLDLLVGWPGHNLLMEVKMPGEKLRPSQVEFFERWKGPKCVVFSLEEALQATGVVCAAGRRLG